MKALVISDSHGHISNLRTIMEIAKKSKVEAVIHCGDWDNVESVKTVLDFGIPLYSVLGNADIEDGMEEYLKFNAKEFESNFITFEIEGRKIGVTHKPSDNKKYFTTSLQGQSFEAGLDIIFNGHLHSSEQKIVDFRKIVRPGALINGINFAIYETENNEVEFVKDE